MSKNRYGKRRDANEPDIVDALKAIGCSVLRITEIDLIVGWRGRNYLLEVKTEKGVLEDSQKDLLLNWRGQYDIVRTVDEALKIVQGND